MRKNPTQTHQCSGATWMETEEVFGCDGEFLADYGAVMGLHHPSSLEKWVPDAADQNRSR